MSRFKLTTVLAIAMVAMLFGCAASEPLVPASEAERREYQAVEAMIARGEDVNAPCGDNDGELRLHRAASEGHAAVVKLLLDNQASEGARDGCGYTALHYAARAGRTRIAEMLLDAGAYVNAHVGYRFGDAFADTPPRRAGITPLHLAAWRGELDTARLLLSRGAKINAAASGGVTPICFAAGSGYLKMVELLIEHGADPLQKTSGGGEVLHFAAGGEMPVLRYRCDVGDPLIIHPKSLAIPDIEAEIAHCGGEYGQIVKLLLAKGAKVDPRESSCYTPLQLAAEYSCASAMEVLIKAGAEVSVKVPYVENMIGGHPKGTTALHLAVGQLSGEDTDESRQTVDLLIRAGAAVNAADEHGSTALHHASYRARPGSIKLLIAAGADINAQSTNLDSRDAWLPERLKNIIDDEYSPTKKPRARKMTPLLAAMLYSPGWRPSEEDFLRGDRQLRDSLAILVKNGADVKAALSNGETALHLASARSNAVSLVKILIDAGADVNSKTSDGVTPLHYAIMADRLVWHSESNTSSSWHIESLKMLLKNGADPNARTVETGYSLPKTALDWAKEEGFDDAVKLLTPVTDDSAFRPKGPTRPAKRVKASPSD